MTTALEDPRWLALSEARRDALLKEHRTTNVEHDWWDFIYERFTEKLEEVGIEVSQKNRSARAGNIRYEPEICFSGFCSQGDGASFAGRVGDWPKFLAVIGKLEWAEHAAKNSWRFSSHKGRGMYMEFSAELDVEENPYVEEYDPLQHAAWAIRTAGPTENDLTELQDACEERFNDLASDLYRDLEEEHDHLTSDEVIVDYILENCEDALTEDEEVTNETEESCELTTDASK